MLRVALLVLLVGLAALAARGSWGTARPAAKPSAGPEADPLRPEPTLQPSDGSPAVTFTLPDEAPASPRAGGNDALADETPPRAVDRPPFDPHLPPDERELGTEERFALPKREDWDTFSHQLSFALATESMEALAALESEARLVLAALDAIPGEVEYAGWLRDRLQDMQIARRAAQPDRAGLHHDPSVPLYDVWLEWMRDRPAPARAEEWVPQLKPIFAAAQLPPALVWLAETESSFNPSARSPAGARGLYQLMPDTARDLGLSLKPHDERLDPLRNAESAARYLSQLHDTFGEWALALAAYNAGPGRISRLLKQRNAKTFAEIASALPTETQLYVPRVLATLTVREGISPAALAMAHAALAAAPLLPDA